MTNVISPSYPAAPISNVAGEHLNSAFPVNGTLASVPSPAPTSSSTGVNPPASSLTASAAAMLSHIGPVAGTGMELPAPSSASSLTDPPSSASSSTVASSLSHASLPGAVSAHSQAPWPPSGKAPAAIYMPPSDSLSAYTAPLPPSGTSDAGLMLPSSFALHSQPLVTQVASPHLPNGAVSSMVDHTGPSTYFSPSHGAPPSYSAYSTRVSEAPHVIASGKLPSNVSQSRFPTIAASAYNATLSSNSPFMPMPMDPRAIYGPAPPIDILNEPPRLSTPQNLLPIRGAPTHEHSQALRTSSSLSALGNAPSRAPPLPPGTGGAYPPGEADGLDKRGRTQGRAPVVDRAAKPGFILSGRYVKLAKEGADLVL